MIPKFVDIDDDGDLDVFTGRYDGYFQYFENTGDVNNPAFMEQSGGANPLDLVDL